jgi:adenylosuccinate lyase
MDGLVVYPKMIEKRIMSELPFMATEYIIMECVKNGGDRQELHERIRVHSMEAGKVVKLEGKDNDLIERIVADDYFNLDKDRLMELLNPKNFVGFSAEQTEEFVNTEVKPIVEKYKNLIGMEASLRV